MSGNPISVGIVMGGISSEHEISNQSGLGMLAQIDQKKFAPFPILITAENKWCWPANKKIPAFNFDISKIYQYQHNPPPGWEATDFPNFTSFPSCDIFLLALHGKGGEDGTLQKVLNEKGQAYTGSGVKGSTDAMNKITSKVIFTANNILTPRYTVFSTFSELSLQSIIDEIKLPLVIKIPVGGSSIGVDIAHTKEDLKKIVSDFKRESPNLLIEEFIKGREATCGFLQNGPKLIPTEIVPKSDDFFNFAAKYNAARTDEITPARFSKPLLIEMQILAEKCHKVLGLSVYSRTDFLLKEDRLYVIEVNSLPGFTANSLLPKGAAAAGLEFKELLTKIIVESLGKKK